MRHGLPAPLYLFAAAAAAGLGCRAPPGAGGAANFPEPWLPGSRAAGSSRPGSARRVSHRRPREERRPPVPRAGSRTHPCLPPTPSPPRRSPPRRSGPRLRAQARRESGRWAPRGSKAGSDGRRKGTEAAAGSPRRLPRPGPLRERPGSAGRVTAHPPARFSPPVARGAARGGRHVPCLTGAAPAVTAAPPEAGVPPATGTLLWRQGGLPGGRGTTPSLPGNRLTI